jgi:hypothetical protein
MHWLMKIPLALATIWATAKITQRFVRRHWKRATENLEPFSAFLLYLAGIWYVALLVLVGILAT